MSITIPIVFHPLRYSDVICSTVEIWPGITYPVPFRKKPAIVVELSWENRLPSTTNELTYLMMHEELLLIVLGLPFVGSLAAAYLPVRAAIFHTANHTTFKAIRQGLKTTTLPFHNPVAPIHVFNCRNSISGWTRYENREQTDESE